MPENDKSLFDEFMAWKDSRRESESAAESTSEAPAEEEAAFASDTTERDKGRTDLPYAVQSDSEPVTGTDPSPAPSTTPTGDPGPIGRHPVPVGYSTAEAPATGVEDAIGRIESMVRDIHQVVSDAQPVISEVGSRVKSEGLGGIFSALMKFGK